MQTTPDQFDIHHGDCLTVMATMDASTVDAIVSDPPYGLSFMGNNWDHGVPGVAYWTEALRVAKPGAHLLAFGGTRTFHRLACAIEDAGWQVRDCVMWVYSSGFPKSLNVGKAIDRAAGAEREVVGMGATHCAGIASGGECRCSERCSENGERSLKKYWAKSSKTIHSPATAPSTDHAKQWDGWGTALKPAWEPIIVARKPIVGTVAANVIEHGTGAMNIDACRIAMGDEYELKSKKMITQRQSPKGIINFGVAGRVGKGFQMYKANGRFPANFIHDGSVEATRGMGEAARYFYGSKTNREDRGEGNNHPTVKPTDLMRYLCRLVTPPNGIVLDPFMGSGSTGKAAILEGFRFIGIDLSAEYCDIARLRCEHSVGEMKEMLFSGNHD